LIITDVISALGGGASNFGFALFQRLAWLRWLRLRCGNSLIGLSGTFGVFRSGVVLVVLVRVLIFSSFLKNLFKTKNFYRSQLF
jgi:hypothetical protein